MKYGLYAIYDTKAQDMGPVFQAKTLGVAVRQFSDLCSKTKYPEDFELWRLGFLTLYTSFDDDLKEEEQPTPNLSSIFEVVALGSEQKKPEDKGQLLMFPEGGKK